MPVTDLLYARAQMGLSLAFHIVFAAAGVAILLIAGGLAYFGVKKLPKKPLPHTQERLKADFDLARETLQ